MNFKFVSPIGRTLESILAEAKKLLKSHGRLLSRKRLGATKYPSQSFADLLGEGLPRNVDGAWSSPESTKRYAAEFYRMNHFR